LKIFQKSLKKLQCFVRFVTLTVTVISQEINGKNQPIISCISSILFIFKYFIQIKVLPRYHLVTLVTLLSLQSKALSNILFFDCHKPRFGEIMIYNVKITVDRSGNRFYGCDTLREHNGPKFHSGINFYSNLKKLFFQERLKDFELN